MAKMKISDVVYGDLHGLPAVEALRVTYRTVYPAGSPRDMVRYVADRTGLSLEQVRRCFRDGGSGEGREKDAKVPRGRAGRPRIAEQLLRKHVVSTSLTDEEFTRLRAAAEVRGVRVRDYVRTLLVAAGNALTNGEAK